MKAIKIIRTNQGSRFRLKNDESNPVWVRGEYIKEQDKYACFKEQDEFQKNKFIKKFRIIYLIK